MSKEAIEILIWCFFTANLAFAFGFISGWFRCEKTFGINQPWIPFDGKVDQVRFYPWALTPKEILQLRRYNAVPAPPEEKP